MDKVLMFLMAALASLKLFGKRQPKQQELRNSVSERSREGEETSTSSTPKRASPARAARKATAKPKASRSSSRKQTRKPSQAGQAPAQRKKAS